MPLLISRINIPYASIQEYSVPINATRILLRASGRDIVIYDYTNVFLMNDGQIIELSGRHLRGSNIKVVVPPPYGVAYLEVLVETD